MRDLQGLFERKFVVPRVGRTLIVGSQLYADKPDRRKLYADVLGVDMLAGPGVDRVVDVEEPLPDDLGQFEHVECCSVLEHSRRPWLLAENLQRLMVLGGTLFLSVPFVWRLHSYPGDLFRFTDQGVRAIFPGIEWRQLQYASDRLRGDHYLRAHDVDGHPYMPRCEVLGFGVRR